MTAKLIQEELQIKHVSLGELARKLYVPLPLLEDAIKGACTLKIGVWKALAAALRLKTENYQFRPNERQGVEGWELYNVLVAPEQG